MAPAFPFAWRILLWSSVGFLVANGLLVGGFLVLARLEPGSGARAPAVKLGLGAALILGPVVASAVGFVGGALLGAVLAVRARAVSAWK
jgi:hypothetical protein